MADGQRTRERPDHEYAVFRRTVESAVPLPQLRGRHGSGRGVAGPSVQVRHGDLPSSPEVAGASLTRVFADPEGEFTIHEDGEDRLYWFYDGVGVLRVSGGTEIVLSPAPASRPAARRWFVRNPGLRTALVQQGAVVVHASAVVVDGRAVGFLGESGRGKSTAAGACVAAGHDLLVDDVLPCALDGDGATVPPGYPSLGLDAAAADTLGFELDGDFDGVVRVGDRFCDCSRPLDTLYLLTDGEEVRTEAVAQSAAVFEMLESSYAFYDESDSTEQGAHLRQCGSLVDRISVRRLARPRSLAALDDLAAAVTADVRERA